MTAPTLHRERPTPELPQIMVRTGQAHRIIAAAHSVGLPMPYYIGATGREIDLMCREWEYAAWRDWLDDTTSTDRIIDGARHLTTEGRKGEVAVHLACVTQLDEVTP